MYTVGPQCKIFNYGLQEELMDWKGSSDLDVYLEMLET